MKCKIVTEADMPQVMDLWDYCFEKKDDSFFQWYFQEYCLRHNIILGGFSEEDGHLQNMLHLNPYQILLREQEEVAPYIVGVATDPADRGHELTGKLLQAAFRLLRRRDCAFALLMPVYAGIYQKYDFAFCYHKHVYEMPLAKLTVPEPSGSLSLERYRSYDASLFADIYAALAEGYNGLPIRTDFQWKKLLQVHQLEKVQAVVVYHGDEPRGYMFYQLTDDRTFLIQELVALTPDAKWTLLHYAKAHQAAVDRLYWEAVEDDLTYLEFADADVAGRLKPFMMARCFDACRALVHYDAPEDCPDGEITLLLKDDLLKENNSTVILRVEDGVLSLEKTERPFQAVISMGAFTQMYFGAYTFTQLVEAGKIQVRAYAPEVFAFMDCLFPKCVNFINEYY